jgi:hypothetical protein
MALLVSGTSVATMLGEILVTYWYVVKFTKLSAITSACLTGLVAAIIIGWQIAAWIWTATWISVSAGNILERADINIPRRYVLSSSTGDPRRGLDSQAIIEGFLDLPAVVPLMVIVAVLVCLYLALARAERRALHEFIALK